MSTPRNGKPVSIRKPGLRDERLDVVINEGVTPRQLLQELRLMGDVYRLGSYTPFDPDEELSSKIEAGEVLLCSHCCVDPGGIDLPEGMPAARRNGTESAWASRGSGGER